MKSSFPIWQSNYLKLTQCCLFLTVTFPNSTLLLAANNGRVDWGNRTSLFCFCFTGTSNWSENYFTHTAGVGLVVNQTGSVVNEGQQTLPSQAEELFLRDWSSEYASQLSLDDVDVCPRGRHWPVCPSVKHDASCHLNFILNMQIWFAMTKHSWIFNAASYFIATGCPAFSVYNCYFSDCFEKVFN